MPYFIEYPTLWKALRAATRARQQGLPNVTIRRSTSFDGSKCYDLTYGKKS